MKTFSIYPGIWKAFLKSLLSQLLFCVILETILEHSEVGDIIPNQIPETSSLSLIHCSGRFFITMKAQIKIGRLEIGMRTSITDPDVQQPIVLSKWD